MLIIFRHQSQQRTDLLIGLYIPLWPIKRERRDLIEQLTITHRLWRSKLANREFTPEILSCLDLFTLNHIHRNPQQPRHRLPRRIEAITMIKRLNDDFL